MRIGVAAALAVCAVIGMAAVAGAFKHHTARPSKVSLKYRASTSATAPYNQQAVVRGRVKAKGPGPIDSRKLCRKNRPISIEGIGNTKSDARGQYVIPLGNNPPTGTFTAKVPKKTANLRHRHMTCFATHSRPITIP
jgi:hypothetical protein